MEGLIFTVVMVVIVIVFTRFVGRNEKGNAGHDGGMYYGAHNSDQSGSSHQQTGDSGGREVSHDGGGFDWGDSGSGGDGGGGDSGGGDGGGGE